MIELQTVIGVIILFVIRIGIPLALLVGLGVLIDRWQSKREEEVVQYRQRHVT
jgi:hypothetical protein